MSTTGGCLCACQMAYLAPVPWFLSLGFCCISFILDQAWTLVGEVDSMTGMLTLWQARTTCAGSQVWQRSTAVKRALPWSHRCVFACRNCNIYGIFGPERLGEAGRMGAGEGDRNSGHCSSGQTLQASLHVGHPWDKREVGMAGLMGAINRISI